MAPKWEKELYKVIRTQQFRDLPRIAQEHPEQAPLVAALDGLMSMSDGNLPHALEALRFAWPRTENLADHPFVRRYLGSSHATVNIAEGVSATFPISHDAVGLALVELEQHAGNMSAAISTAEHLEPSQFAAVSLCELYLVAGRYADVIDMTNNLANENDPTCSLLVFRGAALRERGMLTAAREAFKEALRTHSRAAAIRHLAYFERSRIYLAEGKKAMARKDLERVLAEDATYPGVQDLLAEIIGQGRAPEPDR